MGDWKSEAIRLRTQEGLTWGDLVERFKDRFPKLTLEQARNKVRDVVRNSPEYKEQARTEPPAELKRSEEWNGTKGEYTSDRLIEICERDEITPELILKAHGLKAEKWDVVSYRNNYWHSQVRGGSRMVMYQSRLTAKPKRDAVTLSDIDRYFVERDFSANLPAVEPTQYDPSGEVLEIDIADLHSGLYAWARETGADYDVHIARERFLRVIADNAERCKGRRFKGIILALLGDLLHTDNDAQTTTKGTFQQADGRMAKIFDMTLDMLIEAVGMLGAIAPVDVVYTRGNHDALSGRMLIKALEVAFKRDPNVTVDAEPNPQKWRLIGNTLIGFCHGDMPERNLTGWLQVQARSMDKPVRFMEIHAGHRHSQKAVERIQTQDAEGVVIRTMPTITNASTWEHEQGYASTRSTMSFVWHGERGLREMWFSNM